jgi:hypothetical protein
MAADPDGGCKKQLTNEGSIAWLQNGEGWMEHLHLANGACLVVAVGSAVHLLHTRVLCRLESRWNQLFLGRRRELSRAAFSVWLACQSWAALPWPITPGPSERLHISVLPGRVGPPGRQWRCSTRDGECVMGARNAVFPINIFTGTG